MPRLWNGLPSCPRRICHRHGDGIHRTPGHHGQGICLLDNEGEKVAQAIGEQYMPRFAGDELPQSNEGRILAVADKLDNIVATFSRGMAPTGSQDPYALRRQALGILNIVADGDVHFPLRAVLAETLKNLPVEVENEARLLDEVADFFAQRAKNMLLDKGVRYDVVDAVLAAPGLDDLADIFVRADASVLIWKRKKPLTVSRPSPGWKTSARTMWWKPCGCRPVPGCGRKGSV